MRVTLYKCNYLIDWLSVDTDLTGVWLKRIGAAANNDTSRDAHGQLSGLLDYYNKNQSAAAKKDIDWDGHRANIHTPGVVDKIQAKYDKFMDTEYSVDSAVGKTGGSQTEKMQALDVAMQYNFMLYFVHYSAHLDQLETMRNIGDIGSLSSLEFWKLNPGFESLQASEQEIGNIAPESYIEDGVFTRLCTQFSWGSRYNVPFKHSSDTQSAIAATLGKFGNWAKSHSSFARDIMQLNSKLVYLCMPVCSLHFRETFILLFKESIQYSLSKKLFNHTPKIYIQIVFR